MPDNSSMQSNTQSFFSRTSDVMSRLNQQMYERNAELAVRNRTLSVLGKIYAIINSSVNINETAQNVIRVIVKELQFQNSLIALINKKTNSLNTISVYFSETIEAKKVKEFSNLFSDFKIPLYETENYCIDSIVKKKMHVTNDLHDVLHPIIDEKQAEKVQASLNIQTSIIYPIIFANEVLGVLVLGMDKHVGYLSQAERETLKELIEIVTIAIERAQIYEDLALANNKLKILDKLKDEFVSIASHELRTPMAAIKSYLWLALKGRGGALTEKQTYYIQRSYNSVDRLIKLVNDMLNISRIESGRMNIQFQKTDIAKLIDDIVLEVSPRLNELNLSIKVVKDNKIPFVIADPDKIKEVLINLIGNSLKFTPPKGMITINVKTVDGDVYIEIKDTGKGIEEAYLSKLFQKFGLIEGSYIVNKADLQGTGLGLYICKSIIQMHHGRIWAESEGINKGAKFTFTLLKFSEQKLANLQSQFKGEEGIEIIHSEV